MPIDEDGVRADVISDPSSTVSRLNIGRMYERYLKASSLKTRELVINRMKEILSIKDITKNDVHRLSPEQLKDVFSIIVEFVNILQNQQSIAYQEALTNNNIEGMREIIEETIEEYLYIFLSVDMDKRAYEIVTDLELSKFKATYGSIEFNYYGKRIKTKSPIAIRPMYMFLLSKIADGYLVTSSAKLNHFGLPISVSAIDRYRLPYRNSPTKVLGETETRLYASYCGREFLAEMKYRNVYDQHKIVYRNVLDAKEPSVITDIIPRDKHPYEGDRALDILTALFNAVGIDFDYKEDKQLLHEPQVLEKEVVDLDTVEEIEEDEKIKDEA